MEVNGLNGGGRVDESVRWVDGWMTGGGRVEIFKGDLEFMKLKGLIIGSKPPYLYIEVGSC